jgi:acetylglutamate kinase
VTTPPDADSDLTVVKLGGSTLGAHDTSLHDIASAHRDGRRIVVVHGGGATISAWLARMGIEAKFVRGLRVTDAASLEVVVAVLAGVVTTQLVAELSAFGAPAVGLTGADAGMLQAHRYDDALGFVGKIERVNPAPITDLLGRGYLPVIAPIAIDSSGLASSQLLNTNADTVAGEIAAALRAQRLVFLTDVDAVLDANKRPLAHLTSDEATALIASGAASGGMIPKLEAAIRAATAGCVTNIANGTTAGALARVLVGEAGGTTVGA